MSLHPHIRMHGQLVRRTGSELSPDPHPNLKLTLALALTLNLLLTGQLPQ